MAKARAKIPVADGPYKYEYAEKPNMNSGKRLLREFLIDK
jgi:hypothetical protein